jgi:hypothetical protein|tara:strand:- start:4500 stop:5168 length:669 start_codon:yes stop_codon:yes gene_type:complete
MDKVKAGELRWRGLAWVGAISESVPGVGGNGRWVWKNGRDTEIEPRFFAQNEMDDGQYFGALPLPKNLKKGADGNYTKGSLCSMASFDWKVQGLIMESRPNFSSSYTFNGWALNDHPRMNGAEEGKFCRSFEEAGSEVPLFSEGTGPMIMPDVSDRPAADLRMGGQTGQGLSRATINRYFNRANNVAFADGGVESVKLPDLWRLKWHREWQTPNRLPDMPED